MPLVTPTPVTNTVSESYAWNSAEIESLLFDMLSTRAEGELFKFKIERFHMLDGEIVNSKVVTVPDNILLAEMAKPETQALYAGVRDLAYRILKAMEEAPAEAELVDNPPGAG